MNHGDTSENPVKGSIHSQKSLGFPFPNEDASIGSIFASIESIPGGIYSCDEGYVGDVNRSCLRLPNCSYEAPTWDCRVAGFGREDG